MSMKVLLLNGSPHKSGCTYTALSEAARVLSECGVESEIVWLGIEPIAGCIGCGSCAKTGACFKGDIVNRIAETVGDYDGYIFGTPVHYASPSGAITSALDRLFYSSSAKMRFKPGAVITSCRRGGGTASFDMLNKYFTINNMPIVSSNYWNQIHGNTADEAVRDEEGMQTVRILARNMAWMIKCIEAGKNAGINPPELEAKVKTNFIR